MAKEFKFPDVGEGITEGEIVKWRVKEGDTIKEHDVIADVETDKAIVEIPSPASGVILKLYHKEGDTIKVGEVLASIGDKGEKVSAPSSGAPAKEEKKEKKTEAKPESKGKQEGVGAVGELEEATEVEPTRHEVKKAESETQKSEAHVSATPAVRRLARDNHIDLDSVKGSGKDGRITEEDVRNAAKSAGMKHIEENVEHVEANVQKKYDMWGYVKKVPLKGVRKSIAKHMVDSLFTAPHVSHMDEVDVTELYRLRQREKRIAESKDIKLTFLPFIMKACVQALKKHPGFNSAMDDEHEEIIYKKYYNFGMAVDTENGLMVPVIKGVDQKNIFNLAKEITDLSQKARDRKIDIADMKGSTFTITNIGSIGGMFATPIINYPEAAILAVGRMQDRLVIDKENKIRIRKILPLTVTFDHRVVDGADGAKFMNTLKELLQDPDLMMMEG